MRRENDNRTEQLDRNMFSTNSNYLLTKGNSFMLKAPRDQDLGLEEYITGLHQQAHHFSCPIK